MDSRWDGREAARYRGDPLALRAYASRLLGADQSLVLHGGGNTSLKVAGSPGADPGQDLLLVKASGWDLETIEPEGFTAVRCDAARRLLDRPCLSDDDLRRALRQTLVDPSAPDPSIETVLHALIPHSHVEHTHADALLAVTNTPDGFARVERLYGDRVVVVPFARSGLALARAVADRVRGSDWREIDGLVLMGHGVFASADGARESYEAMIHLVTVAEDYLKDHGALDALATAGPDARQPLDPRRFAALCRAVSAARGRTMVALLDTSPEAAGFAGRADVADLATRGPVTPGHVLVARRVPLIVGDDPARDVGRYVDAYWSDVERYAGDAPTPSDLAPRWAVWPGVGVIAFGDDEAAASIVADIARCTMRVSQWSEALGGWRPLPKSVLLAVELGGAVGPDPLGQV